MARAKTLRSPSLRQSVATLLASPLEDPPTGLAAHPCAEAMLALGPPHFWLICALHLLNASKACQRAQDASHDLHDADGTRLG
jgi:hypothetical protein